MIRRPPRSTRTDTLFPYTTLFRSGPSADAANTGDVEKLLGGKNVISASYDVPMLAHGSPETPGATVRIAGDRCEIWAATQSATLVRDEVASAIGFPTEAVVVYPTLVGGGFGQIGRAHV